jgi:hypothetical protein
MREEEDGTGKDRRQCLLPTFRDVQNDFEAGCRRRLLRLLGMCEKIQAGYPDGLREMLPLGTDSCAEDVRSRSHSQEGAAYQRQGASAADGLDPLEEEMARNAVGMRRLKLALLQIEKDLLRRRYCDDLALFADVIACLKDDAVVGCRLSVIVCVCVCMRVCVCVCVLACVCECV